MGTTTLDERGRITIPQREREKLGLRPGDKVHVQATEEGLTVRRSVSREEFAAAFAGSISEENAVGKGVDPLRVKEIWHLAGG